MNQVPNKRILFVGHSYYHAWYLSRELRKLGWQADVLNVDLNPDSQKYYHGQDYYFTGKWYSEIQYIFFYFLSLFKYDIFHFSNRGGIQFLRPIQLAEGHKYNPINWFIYLFNLTFKVSIHWDIWLLKKVGKKITYANSGCHDGISQSSFKNWNPDNPICHICPWIDTPSICDDKGNLAWGKFRNAIADYQANNGGNRADYNDAPTVHDVPGFYSLDPNFWKPNLEIPDEYKLDYPDNIVKIYHSVGNYQARLRKDKKNIKSTHIYLPLVEQLKEEGYPVEMMFFNEVPNKIVRYYQAQADIVVDMLTFGIFGANVREALMLGKPVICYLRPRWLESMREEIPEYVDELPIISATPRNVREVLIDLIENPAKRQEIGDKSREFAVRWHSAQSGAQHFDKVLSALLRGEEVLRDTKTNISQKPYIASLSSFDTDDVKASVKI